MFFFVLRALPTNSYVEVYGRTSLISSFIRFRTKLYGSTVVNVILHCNHNTSYLHIIQEKARRGRLNHSDDNIFY
jgi:hypothetical protein